MKKSVSLLFFLSIVFYNYSQNTYVPDDNFEQVLIDLGYDSGVLDDYVPTANINTVTSLNVANKSIADLTGIKDFVALTQLYCYGNSLSTLDLSDNTALTDLRCSNNSLTSLDLSKNTALTVLSCSHNSLTSLDVSNNMALINLSCENNSLTSLDVSNNTALADLSCSNNSLTSLDVSKNPALTYLECYINNSLTSLDLSKNTALTHLWCFNNSLTSLNLTNNTALTDLWCSYNSLTSLNLTNNTALTDLFCDNNLLTSLNVKNGNNANLTSFDARNNPNLICIEIDNVTYSTANWPFIDAQTSFSENCAEMAYVPDDNFEKALIDLGYDTGNPDDYVPIANIDTITSLDISGKEITDLSGIEYFNDLITLICSNNNLTNLLISKNTSLEQLVCINNNLTDLDVSQNSALTILYCNNNSLTNLNIDSNNLNRLYCNNNSLTSLDLRNSTFLQLLYCYNNNLNSLNVKNGNNTNIIRFDTTNNPNLTCIDVDDKVYSTANWTSIDPQTGFSETCGTLGIDDFLDSSISIHPNPTNNFVTIEFTSYIEIKNIKTFDILGKQLSKTKTNTVDLSDFQSGLYYIKMETNKGSLTKKVIKI